MFQFRISVSQVFYQLRHQLIKERAAHVQESIAVTHGTTQNTTDDIPGFLVARQLTVRDGKRDGTDMVRNHAHSDIGLLIYSVFASADSADFLEHRLEHIRVVIRGLALYRTNQTLEAHTGVNHLHRQRLQRTVRLAVVLHEHDVPNLNHLRMIFVHQFATGDAVTLVERTAVHMYLRARTAGTGITHLPEIIVLVAVQNMVCRQVFCPNSGRLVITRQTVFRRALKHRRIQVLRINLQYIHDVLPREINRLFLEIIAERPVAQHLKHRVVVGVVSHFLQVVVLTAHAQTFLTVRHTRILDGIVAQDDTLPRVHTGIGEHQAWVVFDNHRSRRHYLVTFRRHKIQKGLSNLFTCHLFVYFYFQIDFHLSWF